MPPRPGRPPRVPNPRQVTRRRALALGVLVLLLGGLGWLAVAAIGGGDGETEAPTTSSSTLIYRTVTKTTASGPVETVIAMPKPFHIVFPEGFTRQEMADRVAAVGKIAERKRHVNAKLSRRAYLSATRKPRAAACLHSRVRTIEGFLFPATYEFCKMTSSAQLVKDSPYNTRKHAGLPPTPIANPGLASMQAAAHPAKVNYLYFVRKPDKKHHFFTASFKAFQDYARTHGYGGP